MELLEAIKTRRSVRKFEDRAVDHETIAEIVAVATYAPSWKNTQVARYHVLENKELQTRIAEEYVLGFGYNTGTISHAPQVVALTALKGRSGMERDGSATTSKGESWLMFDAGIAAQTFCLAAWEKGVGSVIMGIFDAEKVGELLQIPENEVVVALICIGYPAETPDAPPRKDVDTLLHYVE